MATIKVPFVVRDRVRDAARAAHLTQAQLIEDEERRKAESWGCAQPRPPTRSIWTTPAEAEPRYFCSTTSRSPLPGLEVGE